MNTVELIHKSYQEKFSALKNIEAILSEIISDNERVQLIELKNKINSVVNNYNIIIFSQINELYNNKKIEDTELYMSIIKSNNYQNKINDILSGLIKLSKKINIEGKKEKQLEKELNRFKSNIIYRSNVVADYNDCIVCKEPMREDNNNGDLICDSCGYIKKVYGNKYYYQEKTKNMHNTSKYCDKWIEKIEGKSVRKIPDEIINKVKHRCYITETINPTYRDIRCILKKIRQTKYNHFCPYIRWKVTGEKPEYFTKKEKNTIKSYFMMIIDIFLLVKENGRSNKPNFPYFIFKLVDLLLPDCERKFKIMDAIHLQESKTLIKNDIYWKKICEKMEDEKIYYKPTNKFYRDN